jgi:hypothetical protein
MISSADKRGSKVLCILKYENTTINGRERDECEHVCCCDGAAAVESMMKKQPKQLLDVVGEAPSPDTTTSSEMTRRT